MNLSSAIKAIRDANIAALSTAVNQNTDCFVEPAYLDDDGEVVVEGPYNLPCRADLITRIDGCPGDSVMVNSALVNVFADFEVIESNIPLTIGTFHWDNANFTASLNTETDLAPLIEWFYSWFDAADENEPDAYGLYGVTHFMSDPHFVEDKIEFTVDFGSAPEDVFFSLIHKLSLLGAKFVSVV